MAPLRAAGLVISLHGPGGGYILARPAEHISVADIFEAIDAPSGFARPPLNGETLEDDDISNLHGTDLLWEALKNRVLSFLDDVSLADLAPEAVLPVGETGSDDRVYPAGMGSTLRH